MSCCPSSSSSCCPSSSSSCCPSSSCCKVYNRTTTFVCPTSGIGIYVYPASNIPLTPGVPTLVGPLINYISNKISVVGTNSLQIQVAGPYTIQGTVFYALSAPATTAFTTTTTVQVNGVTVRTLTSDLYPIGTNTSVSLLSGPNILSGNAVKTNLAVGDLVTFLVTATTPGAGVTISLDTSSQFTINSSC